MRQKVKERARRDLAGEECHHYWIIEIANGPKSRGECKYCGQTRYFLNSIPGPAPPKRNTNPLDLPKLSGVEMAEDSKS